MQGYKLTNTNGSTYGYFCDVERANRAASQNLMLHGTILDFQEVELPELVESHWNLIDQHGNDKVFESDSLEQLKSDVEFHYQDNANLHETYAIQVGVDAEGNDVEYQIVGF